MSTHSIDASRDSVPMTTLFRGGIIQDGHAVVGLWLLDAHHLLRNQGWTPHDWDVPTVLWVARRVPGDIVAWVARHPREASDPTTADLHPEGTRPDGERIAIPFQVVLRLLDAMRTRFPHVRPPPTQFLRNCDAWAATARLDPADVVEQAIRDLGVTRDAIEPFLSTLDPAACRIAQEITAYRAGVTAYRMLDETLMAECPLRKAWDWEPFHRLATIRFAEAEPVPFAEAIQAGPSCYRRRLSDRIAREPGMDRRAGRLALVVGDAMPSMAQEDRDVFSREFEGLAPASGAARHLAALPGSWVPDDPRAWAAFAACGPAVAHAVDTAPRESLAKYLNVGDDWVRYAARLAAAHGDGPGWRPLERAISRGVRDMVQAFAVQVALPAHRLTRPGEAHPTAMQCIAAATVILTHGLSLRSVLEASRRWHALQAHIDAGLPRAPGPPPSWPACLPDAVRGEVAIRVLTTRDELVAEGARGIASDGMVGLSHCVGGYVGPCLDGRCRILSLTSIGPGGAVRLSTAELAWRDGRATVMQHAGASNASPPARAGAALARYVRDLGEGVLKATCPDLPVISEGGRTERLCGYDWDAPGAWETVHAAWSPILPGHARHAGVADIGAAVPGQDVVKLSWSPDPWCPGPGTRLPSDAGR